MNFKRPLIVNLKNYSEISGPHTMQIAKAASDVANRAGVEVVLAPPQGSLALIASAVEIPVICQHFDDAKGPSTTGFFLPELAKSYGSKGSLINHSEHRMGIEAIINLISRLRELAMTSIVCAQTPLEVEKIAIHNPDFIAIEPPELIGTGRAVSRENPLVIIESVKAAAKSNSKVICGAGISDKKDVSKALELGSLGILVASSVVKASSWNDKIAELASGMQE